MHLAKIGQKFEFAINLFSDIENRKYFMGVLLDQVPTTNLRMRAVLKYFAQPRALMLESLRCGLLSNIQLIPGMMAHAFPMRGECIPCVI